MWPAVGLAEAQVRVTVIDALTRDLPGVPSHAMAEAIAALAERAGRHGLSLSLEFMPGTSLATGSCWTPGICSERAMTPATSACSRPDPWRGYS